MTEIPQKPFYKIREVCRYTDTQPYVVRFWESEFPQLAPDTSRGGQPVYSRDHIELILRIKELLYEEEFTLEDARRQIAKERKRGGARSKKGRVAARKKVPAREASPEAAAERPVEPRRQERAAANHDLDSVPRARYEDAVDEVAHLRLQLQEAEAQTRTAEAEAEDYRRRCERAVERLEKLLERLS
jgi:DNA-binding transcriptional MerR regulator